MAEDLLDANVDFIVETTGYVLASIGVGPDNENNKA